MSLLSSERSRCVCGLAQSRRVRRIAAALARFESLCVCDCLGACVRKEKLEEGVVREGWFRRCRRKRPERNRLLWRLSRVKSAEMKRHSQEMCLWERS